MLPMFLAFIIAPFAPMCVVNAGRMPTEGQSYREMFDKADLVVIATAVETKDTNEHLKLLNSVNVVGVETQFKTRLIIKGPKNLKQFVLHHYREPNGEFVENGPALIHIPGGQHPDFVLFLLRETDGRYAPITGQTDPLLFSVLELKGAVQSEEQK